MVFKPQWPLLAPLTMLKPSSTPVVLLALYLYKSITGQCALTSSTPTLHMPPRRSNTPHCCHYHHCQKLLPSLDVPTLALSCPKSTFVGFIAGRRVRPTTLLQKWALLHTYHRPFPKTSDENVSPPVPRPGVGGVPNSTNSEKCFHHQVIIEIQHLSKVGYTTSRNDLCATSF